MAPLSVGPGDDVDAWCGKCLMVMNHRIIAVVGSQIKKVECLTCHAIHAYRSAPGTKPEKVSSRKSPDSGTKSGSGRTPRQSRVESEWNVFMSEIDPDQKPRLYRVSESFMVTEFVEHPNFGIGRVLEITGREKMVVIFKEGRKTLICNHGAKVS
ncbi:MAG: hypothetical protein V1897_01995 [Pseudomonadota bacterium]